ncbi:MAG TPA: hypothetical protein VFN67_10340 [Polyangiales bacterium]|jgi:hypothetical protein|nr:hypothetical protein [Polyangiales bacterium]
MRPGLDPVEKSRWELADNTLDHRAAQPRAGGVQIDFLRASELEILEPFDESGAQSFGNKPPVDLLDHA